MSRKFTTQELRRQQVSLVTNYLELCADQSVEIDPDSLICCAMLLAGSAVLADPGCLLPGEVIATGEIPTSFSDIGNAPAQD